MGTWDRDFTHPIIITAPLLKMEKDGKAECSTAKPRETESAQRISEENRLAIEKRERKWNRDLTQPKVITAHQKNGSLD